jgi:hypothetical protein
MSTATSAAPKLDDLMLAMDVVDTIRHREDVLERELSLGDKDEALIERLREIYTSQGITVTDGVLKEGVKALKEQRFQYKAPPGGMLTVLFKLWINRGKVSAFIGIIALALGIAWYSDNQSRQQAAEAVQQQQVDLSALPGLLNKEAADTLAISRDPVANQRVAAFKSLGETAIRDGNMAEANQALMDIKALRARLSQDYQLVIVSRPGERTGIFRIPDDQPGARNYYIIVEAINAAGRKLALPITSEENQRTRTVDQFAVRVPKATYDAIGRDKQQDGIVQDNILGRKDAGFLTDTYLKPANGGMITEWE